MSAGVVAVVLLVVGSLLVAVGASPVGRNVGKGVVYVVCRLDGPGGCTPPDGQDPPSEADKLGRSGGSGGATAKLELSAEQPATVDIGIDKTVGSVGVNGGGSGGSGDSGGSGIVGLIAAAVGFIAGLFGGDDDPVQPASNDLPFDKRPQVNNLTAGTADATMTDPPSPSQDFVSASRKLKDCSPLVRHERDDYNKGKTGHGGDRAEAKDSQIWAGEYGGSQAEKARWKGTGLLGLTCNQGLPASSYPLYECTPRYKGRTLNNYYQFFGCHGDAARLVARVLTKPVSFAGVGVTKPLYDCLFDGTKASTFLSNDPGCEGRGRRTRVGPNQDGYLGEVLDPNQVLPCSGDTLDAGGLQARCTDAKVYAVDPGGNAADHLDEQIDRLVHLNGGAKSITVLPTGSAQTFQNGQLAVIDVTQTRAGTLVASAGDVPGGSGPLAPGTTGQPLAPPGARQITGTISTIEDAVNLASTQVGSKPKMSVDLCTTAERSFQQGPDGAALKLSVGQDGSLKWRLDIPDAQVWERILPANPAYVVAIDADGQRIKTVHDSFLNGPSGTIPAGSIPPGARITATAVAIQRDPIDPQQPSITSAFPRFWLASAGECVMPGAYREGGSVSDRVERLRRSGLLQEEKLDAGEAPLTKLLARLSNPRDTGAPAELGAIERYVSAGKHVLVLSDSSGRTIKDKNGDTVSARNPDFDIRDPAKPNDPGQLVDIKARVDALSKNWVSAQVRSVNEQVRDSGLPNNTKGGADLVLTGDAVNASNNDIANNVRGVFNTKDSPNLDRVFVYKDGRLVLEWRRQPDGTVKQMP